MMKHEELIKRLRSIQETASELDAWYISNMLDDLIDDVESSSET